MSNRYALQDLFPRKLVPRALHQDRAAPQNNELVGKIIGEIEILLDQNDGHLSFGSEVANYLADLLDDVGLNAFSRFVQQQKLRLGDQRSGNSKLLLLATRQITPAP
eukprot:CAMPEP_0195332872 /NCGR_PEP_ID=MMETSP0708-20121125/13637_1 /TAXON_ID=33640 /ORGANISM="Asterionellopsis glacialis, Strain CCMP134" /LENGTH=106 /DNA_ID=CAMNT_0040401915 /DNA_START=102 /DNA_END=419 /DNA_ORIENTATION=-